jgi:hypothetical protein
MHFAGITMAAAHGISFAQRRKPTDEFNRGRFSGRGLLTAGKRLKIGRLAALRIR